MQVCKNLEIVYLEEGKLSVSRIRSRFIFSSQNSVKFNRGIKMKLRKLKNNLIHIELLKMKELKAKLRNKRISMKICSDKRNRKTPC